VRSQDERVSRLRPRRLAARGNLERFGAGIVGQGVLPALGDLFVHLQQRFLEMAGLWLTRLILEFERDARAVGKTLDRFDEGNVFVLANEGEDVSALVTAKAVKDLTMRIDVEAGGLLLVKGQRATKFAPARLSGRTAPMTSTMSLAARICSRVAGGISPAMPQGSPN
jgi:hypothetical protein